MRRAQQLVGFLVLFLAMTGVGYGLHVWWEGPQPEPAGWCCAVRGNACTQSANLSSCRADGGAVFDISQSVCTAACVSLR